MTAEGAPGNQGTNPPQDQIAEIVAKESVSKEDNISIPSNPHGDWLVVQRRQKKQPKPIIASNKNESSKILTNNKLMTSAKAHAMPKVPFNVGSSTTPNVDQSRKNSKKRSRREDKKKEGVQAPSPSPQTLRPPIATPQAPQTSRSTSWAQGQRIFDVGEGSKTTMNITHLEGNHYHLGEEEDN